MAVADGSGSVTARYRYRAFGERINLSGGAPDRHDPSFQNRTYDAGLGLYDYRNRTFDSATGRFLQRDPVMGGDKLFNPYCFPGNNPVTRTDPMGDKDLDLRDDATRIIEQAHNRLAALRATMALFGEMRAGGASAEELAAEAAVLSAQASMYVASYAEARRAYLHYAESRGGFMLRMVDPYDAEDARVEGRLEALPDLGRLRFEMDRSGLRLTMSPQEETGLKELERLCWKETHVTARMLTRYYRGAQVAFGTTVAVEVVLAGYLAAPYVIAAGKVVVAKAGAAATATGAALTAAGQKAGEMGRAALQRGGEVAGRIWQTTGGRFIEWWYSGAAQQDPYFRALSLKEKILCELGQKTLRPELYERFKFLDPLSRGRALIEHFGGGPIGWLRAIITTPAEAQQFVKTLATGPTPAVREVTGAAGRLLLLFGLGATGGDIPKSPEEEKGR
jgi:RHS repeat-associated protein